MSTETTRQSQAPASGPPDALRQGGVQTQSPASDTTVLISEAEVALATAAAAGVRRNKRRWGAQLRRIFTPPKESGPNRRPYRPRMAYLDHPRMAREMERL